MNILQEYRPKIDCSCNGEYKYPVNAGCWKVEHPSWNSLDFKLPCYVKIGRTQEGFGELSVSPLLLLLVVFILLVILWFINKKTL